MPKAATKSAIHPGALALKLEGCHHLASAPCTLKCKKFTNLDLSYTIVSPAILFFEYLSFLLGPRP